MTDFALTLPARARTAATRKSGPVPARAVSGLAGTGAALSFIALGLGKTFRRAAHRPARTLVQLGVLGIGGLIIINALSLQTARHPALMAARSQAPAADQVSDRPPLPPSRPAELSAAPGIAIMPTTTPANRETAAPQTRPLPAAPPAAVTRNADPIGDLLRGDGPRADVAASATAREPSRPVIAAQRALVKLGYTQIKADGVPGDATRSAIERFERERKLPVTGQLNPRTMRELAAASGMKLD